MSLPDEVMNIVAVLAALPQSWLADHALEAARDVEARWDAEPWPDVDQRPPTARTQAMLDAIEEEVDNALQLMGRLPQALHGALAQVSNGAAFDAIHIASDDGNTIALVARDGASAVLRQEIRNFIQQLAPDPDADPDPDLEPRRPGMGG